MWSKPDEAAVVWRMRVAHAHARSILGLAATPGGQEAWGWKGRTLGKPVTTPEGPVWLRVVSAPSDHIIDTFWNGAAEAERLLPTSIPRPQLHHWLDWSDGAWAYRGELYDYVTARPVAPHAIVTTSTDLQPKWWSTLRAALHTITTVNTTRMTIQPGFLAWAMPHYLGITPSDYAIPSWATAHGDLHLANLCAPDFCILDWEGWGLAPPGYDAATLHSYSLLTPDTAAQVRDELAHLLDNPAGQFAELVVITELLHTAEQGEHQDLAEPLRRRAASILRQSP